MNTVEQRRASNTHSNALTGQNVSVDEAREDHRFRRLLGEQDWLLLSPAIRRRFGKRLKGGSSVAYQGHIEVMRFNRFGRLFANLARVIGAPLPFDPRSVGRPAVVIVTEDPASEGQFWTRQYGRSEGFPQTVHSSKQFCGPTGLEEHIGFGIGMCLTLEATPDTLWFVSESYFIDIASLRVKLPGWLSPGKLIVGHRELGSDRFVFSLNLTHPLFGELLSQEAMFRDGDLFDGGSNDDPRFVAM